MLSLGGPNMKKHLKIWPEDRINRKPDDWIISLVYPDINITVEELFLGTIYANVW